MAEKKFTKMTEDEFYKKYHPVKNHLNDNASFDGCMFETYGKEIDYIRKMNYIKEMNSNTDTNRKIWTIVEYEDNIYYLSGYHWVNRLGFLVTEEAVPEDIEIEVILDK